MGNEGRLVSWSMAEQEGNVLVWHDAHAAVCEGMASPDGVVVDDGRVERVA